MNKIVILDGFTAAHVDLSWELLEDIGELTVYDRTKPDETIERAKEAEIVLTNKVVIGKEVFGGSGMNFLNPALVARAFLFFSYPTHMSGDQVWIAADLWGTDAIAGATPMGQLATGINPTASALDMFIGTIPGSTCETSVIAILLGAIVLLFSGIGSWRIMLSVVLGGGAMGLLFNAIGANNYMQLPFYYHYLMGGFMFGAVFMATDPVTSAQTNTGKWIYGLLIGAFAVLLRVLNPAYPEGMMLSILLMNCFAPLIDHCVVSRNIKMRERRVLAGKEVKQ